MISHASGLTKTMHVPLAVQVSMIMRKMEKESEEQVEVAEYLKFLYLITRGLSISESSRPEMKRQFPHISAERSTSSRETNRYKQRSCEL